MNLPTSLLTGAKLYYEFALTMEDTAQIERFLRLQAFQCTYLKAKISFTCCIARQDPLPLEDVNRLKAENILDAYCRSGKCAQGNRIKQIKGEQK